MSKPLRCVVVCAALTGCYTYIPITPGDTPPAGEPVALEITDAGRVGLSERFGPGLMRVEGRLTTSAVQDYALNVHRVSFLGAPATRWSGELVRIDRGFVGRIQQRKLSRGRTALTVGVVTLAVTALFISADLVGFFDGSGSSPPGPPDPASNRVGH
ncbi:MAG: hypothetical protein ACREOG_22430 [Gemmatimonadaceae bacterium]